MAVLAKRQFDCFGQNDKSFAKIWTASIILAHINHLSMAFFSQPSTKHPTVVLLLAITAITSHTQSSFYLFEVGEIIRIFYSLQKPVNVSQVRQFRVEAFHAARQNVGHCTLFVESVAQLSVDSAKDGIAVAAPNVSEVFKFLEFETPDPFEKALGDR